MSEPKHKTDRKFGWKTLALFLAIGILILLWQHYESQAPEGAVAKQAVMADSTDLMAVTIPSELQEELLEYPGFTVSYNPIHKQPNYVMWELTRDEVHTNAVGGRPDNFQPDYNVKGSPTLEDYRGSGYDRGHMAPSGDMKWSKRSSEACFYLTNMSPQNHELNAGAWRTLEERCRDWAVRDSAIVIVCGPILTDKITRHIGRSHVSVPERYFKVVLSPFTDPPHGIGFIMNNSSEDQGMQTSAVSIDEVEAITGYDFFAPLPDEIETKVESECNFPLWNRYRH